jgi:hypothetical protein
MSACAAAAAAVAKTIASPEVMRIGRLFRAGKKWQSRLRRRGQGGAPYGFAARSRSIGHHQTILPSSSARRRAPRTPGRRGLDGVEDQDPVLRGGGRGVEVPVEVGLLLGWRLLERIVRPAPADQVLPGGPREEPAVARVPPLLDAVQPLLGRGSLSGTVPSMRRKCPPGRRTLAASPTNFSGELKWCGATRAVTRSKVASGKGISSAAKRRVSSLRPASRRSFSAASSIFSDTSPAVTLQPIRATRSAVWPPPVAMSRARAPGAGAGPSAPRRHRRCRPGCGTCRTGRSAGRTAPPRPPARRRSLTVQVAPWQPDDESEKKSRRCPIINSSARWITGANGPPGAAANPMSVDPEGLRGESRRPRPPSWRRRSSSTASSAAPRAAGSPTAPG